MLAFFQSLKILYYSSQVCRSLSKSFSLAAGLGALHSLLLEYVLVSGFVYLILGLTIVGFTAWQFRELFYNLRSKDPGLEAVKHLDRRFAQDGRWYSAYCFTKAEPSELAASFLSGESRFFKAPKFFELFDKSFLFSSTVAATVFAAVIVLTGQSPLTAFVPASNQTINEDYTVTPDTDRILRGSSVEFKIAFFKDDQEIKDWSGRRVKLIYYAETGEVYEHSIGRSGTVLHSIHRRFQFQFKVEYSSGANKQTPLRTVDIYEPVHFKDIKVSVSPPAYLRQYVGVGTSTGDIFAYPGSYIKVNATASAPLTKATIAWQAVKAKKFSLRDMQAKSDGRIQTGGFGVKQPGIFRIDGQDKSGNAIVSSPLYQVRIQKDEPPRINVVGAGETIKIPELGILKLKVSAQDDFVVAGLSLIGLVNNVASFFEKIKIETKPSTAGHNVTHEVTVDLSELSINRGQTIRFIALGHDNKPVNLSFAERTSQGELPTDLPPYVWNNIKAPGQWSSSQPLALYFMRYDEKLLSENKDTAASLKDLKTLLKKEKAVSREINALKERTKAKRRFSKEDRQKLNELAKESAANSQKLQKLKEKLSTSQAPRNEYEKRKVENINKALNDGLETKIRKKERKLNDLTQKLGLSYKQSVQNLELLKDGEYLSQLERSIESLKQMLLERELSAIHKALGDLKKKQAALVAKNIEQKDRKILAEEQQSIKQKVAKLESRMRELAKSDIAKENKMEQKLSKLAKNNKWQKAMKSSQNAAQKMQDQKWDDSLDSQRQSEEAIADLEKGLFDTMQAFRQMDIQTAITAIEKAVYDFLQSSQVMNQEFAKLPAQISQSKKGEADRAKYKRMAKLSSHLERSVASALANLRKDAGKSGLVHPMIYKAFEDTAPMSSNLRRALERSETQNSFLHKQILENGINRANARLLEMLNFLRKIQKQQQKASGSQQGQRKTGQQMATGQSISKMFGRARQGKGLSKGEERYLQGLLKKQRAMAGQKPGDGANQESESNSDEASKQGGSKSEKQQAEEIEKAMQDKNYKKALEKQKILNERFLKSSQARKKRGLKKKRQSPKAKFEYRPGNDEALPANIMDKKFREFKAPKNPPKDLTPSEQKFYKNYLRSLDR